MPVYREWTPPVETEIPDLHGWLVDIDSAREFAARLMQESERLDPDFLLIDALSTASIMRYCRCFTSGIRVRLQIDRLPSAAEVDVALHKRLCAVRDKHIAHAVNHNEAHALYVMIDDSPDASTCVLGLSSQGSALIPLSPVEAEEMIGLCKKWIEHLKNELAREKIRLRPYVELLSRDEILALPIGEPQPSEDVHSKRHRRPVTPNQSLQRSEDP